jgi:hypothetical protein
MRWTVPKARLTRHDILVIRRAKPGRCSKCGRVRPFIKRLAAKYKVNRATIAKIRRREIYKRVRTYP